jgi:hypothetical protein
MNIETKLEGKAMHEKTFAAIEKLKEVELELQEKNP